MTDDEEKIRELLATYALALDLVDFDACLQLFTDDGEFVVFGRTWQGIEKIRTMFTSAPQGLHLVGAARIAVDGMNATVRSQVLFVESGTHELRPGIYDDLLVNTDGRWRFRRRRCQFLTAGGVADRPD